MQNNLHKTKPNSYSFLKSIFTIDGLLIETEDVVKWLTEQNQSVNVSVQKIEFKELINWEFSDGRVIHSSGRFYNIDGSRIATNWGSVRQWDQPIINQPEIGYLGFITKEYKRVLHFLMQAKFEPGNVNFVQLSPTLQHTATTIT